MVQVTDKSNRFVLAMLAILGAVVVVYVWYRFAA